MNKKLLSCALAALVGITAPLSAQEDTGGAKKKSPVKAQMEKLDEALDAVGDCLDKPAGESLPAFRRLGQDCLESLGDVLDHSHTTIGVLPVPPTVILPTTISGTGGCHCARAPVR